jgi:hypothetical protein
MARRVFISFRFSDGENYKNELSDLFDQNDDVIDFSEDQDRSHLSEEAIKKYLYQKLKYTSVIIVLLTPNAINYKKNAWTGEYDDWMYDELRYSLEDREFNRTKGVIAVYVDEVKDLLYSVTTHVCEVCNKEKSLNSIKNFDNLVRKNMLNIKDSYKKNECINVYDSLEDSYASLVNLSEFVNNVDKYIENATSKRERLNEFCIVKRM